MTNRRIKRTMDGTVTGRTIVSGDTVKEVERRIHTIDPELEVIGEKVDSLYEKDQQFTKLKAEFASKTKTLEKEIKEAKAELLEAAKRKKIKKFLGRVGEIVVKPSSKSEINARKFVDLLKRRGQTALAWNYLQVGIGTAKSAFGEKVLENEGVLTTETEEYGSISVVKR